MLINILVALLSYTSVTLALFVYDAFYYADDYLRYSHRNHGLIAFTDKQKIYMYLAWPLTTIAVIAVLVYIKIPFSFDIIKSKFNKGKQGV